MYVSCACVAASGNTQRSRGTPSAVALAAEHTISAADCSTALLAFMTFVYGHQIQRLSGVGVRICSAVSGSRIQAWGLSTATALNLAHNSLMRTR